MAQYNHELVPYSNELYHYGVKGMKWGVRKKRTSSSKGESFGSKAKKAAVKVINKKIEKAKKRRKSYNTTTDIFGVTGAAMRSNTSRVIRKTVKGVLAQAINSAANVYISNNSANYRVARGVDFVRRASIKGLSISARMDDLRYYSDIAQSAMHKAGMM